MRTDDSRSQPDFYASLPMLENFERLADPSVYTPVPDRWVVGLADIVKSTAAIAAGQYKEVNTAAAAVIAAVSNALPGHDFPFVFGGDGASFALDAPDEAVGRLALARTAAWISGNFGLKLRTAMVPVAQIRSNGHDLKLARFAVSPDVSYAMFSGGGLAWSEAQMKAGAFAIPPASDDAGPDLTGLSCRFSEIPAKHGVILSIIVMPQRGDGAAFEKVVVELLSIAAVEARAASPVPVGGPALAWAFKGLAMETKTSSAKTGRSVLKSAVYTGLRTFFANLTFTTGQTVGNFDPRRYLHELVRNSDFRKFDDGLRMTLDCTPEMADRIETLLRTSQENGAVLFGLHRQAAALMTCFVPSPTRSDHVHFVDGASGGYAMAAQSFKSAAGAGSSSDA